MPVHFVQFTTTSIKVYEDTSFVTSESPRILEIRDDLANKPANIGIFINDGAGDILIAIQNDERSDYGDNFTTKNGDMLTLNGLNIRRIRLTWGSNSSYRSFFG